jgi:hypothetical protein
MVTMRKHIQISEEATDFLRISENAAFEDLEKWMFHSTPIRTTRKLNSL